MEEDITAKTLRYRGTPFRSSVRAKASTQRKIFEKKVGSKLFAFFPSRPSRLI